MFLIVFDGNFDFEKSLYNFTSERKVLKRRNVNQCGKQNESEEKSQNSMTALAFILVLTFCTTYGTRTRDSSVKGRRLNLLTNAAFDLGSANIRLIYFSTKLILK